MAAVMLVFENDEERAMKLGDLCHDWENQERIFGKETEKMLELCDKLFYATVRHKNEEKTKILKKIYGIAKSHGLYVTWYGHGGGACEPDRFLISGHGHEELAFIQV